jgi:hypothetical protein
MSRAGDTTPARAAIRAELETALAAIGVAAELLAPHRDLFDRYARERRDMDNFGHIVDPTLFKSSERRATDAIVGPCFAIARDFLVTIEEQKRRTREALGAVTAGDAPGDAPGVAQ